MQGINVMVIAEVLLPGETGDEREYTSALANMDTNATFSIAFTKQLYYITNESLNSLPTLVRLLVHH